MAYKMYVVERRVFGDSAWHPSSGHASRLDVDEELDTLFSLNHRGATYAPEDPTPGLLAAWQEEHRGEVVWRADGGAILCVLVADDSRRAVGHSTPLDPFGAARVALNAWAAKWGGSGEAP